jgi:hypothetical protein
MNNAIFKNNFSNLPKDIQLQVFDFLKPKNYLIYDRQHDRIMEMFPNIADAHDKGFYTKYIINFDELKTFPETLTFYLDILKEESEFHRKIYCYEYDIDPIHLKITVICIMEDFSDFNDYDFFSFDCNAVCNTKRDIAKFNSLKNTHFNLILAGKTEVSCMYDPHDGDVFISEIHESHVEKFFNFFNTPVSSIVLIDEIDNEDDDDYKYRNNKYIQCRKNKQIRYVNDCMHLIRHLYSSPNRITFIRACEFLNLIDCKV